MDDAPFGTRNKRGDFAPSAPLRPAPIWALPPKPLAVLKWLPGYFLPWNLVMFAIALVLWTWATPAISTLKFLSPGWIIYLYLRNSAIVFAFYGALELRLYLRRAQGKAFKFNAKWPAENSSDVFMFKNQIIDGMIRTFTSGVPVWTAYEVLALWCYANGIGHWTTFADHPVWLTLLTLLIPAFHEAHFFCIHRLIHIPFLYKYIHSVHHNSVNPSPWSSLSMHPIEHLLYWSGSLLYFIIPTHPLIVLYQLNFAGVGAVVGHIGFDKIVTGDKTAMDTHAYAHYLHHKYFEVNYADGTVPLDIVFGTWHDGTAAGDARLDARMTKKRVRLHKNA